MGNNGQLSCHFCCSKCTSRNWASRPPFPMTCTELQHGLHHVVGLHFSVFQPGAGLLERAEQSDRVEGRQIARCYPRKSAMQEISSHPATRLIKFGGGVCAAWKGVIWGRRGRDYRLGVPAFASYFLQGLLLVWFCCCCCFAKRAEQVGGAFLASPCQASLQCA